MPGGHLKFVFKNINVARKLPTFGKTSFGTTYGRLTTTEIKDSEG